MIFYVTFNDTPSGIYSSQVIDVVNFIETNFKCKIRLIAFISLRGFWFNRNKIKQDCPTAIILPMFPGIHRWRKNKLIFNLICRIYKPKIVIGRSVFATQLAQNAKKNGLVNKVVYDGRGAIEAEWKEYDVITNEKMLFEIHDIEHSCINDSDYRIAVSNQLIEHWREVFFYNKTEHVVIPCTINNQFFNLDLNSEELINKRNVLGLNSNDIVYVYSGSIAGWQSFEILLGFIEPLLEYSERNKMIFFSNINENIQSLIVKFPKQVICKLLKPNEISEYLSIGDYGLLLREESITNKVASPVKFAEYLACGLRVIISENLGDYSNYISRNKELGSLITDSRINENIDFDKKNKIKHIAEKFFSKTSYTEQYKKVIS